MLATIAYNDVENDFLNYIDNSSLIHRLTDSSTSYSDAWRACINLCDDYIYKTISDVFLKNLSENMLDNFRQNKVDFFR